MENLPLVPLIPFVSAALLIATAGRLPKMVVGLLGAGSIAVAGLLVLNIGIEFLRDPTPMSIHLWTWISINEFKPAFAFYLDGLALVMMSVITGVGFLIHLYSTEFMQDDASFSRYFAYMNLFVSAMLILVLADNLLLMFLGWEGVGICSYLLVGFWYQDPANGAAARKAFIVTRIGDTSMALGLFLLVAELGTLNILEVAEIAKEKWEVGATIPTIACALILGGGLGKSAQLPLQTWLPDAMAGPTPCSALIHAATMVTAGVYLVARNHELFMMSPLVMSAISIIGVATLLLAAFTALNQHDLKKILAYSTISQIGYMFLALGVGAYSAAIFHLMTHAFFKALLFLGAGAVIHCLHHEHDIFKMGGLRKKLPVVFWSFLIGSSALAALPFTSGWYSKDEILLATWSVPSLGPWLWAGGIAGAILTAIYSFRLVFVVFWGEAKTIPDKQPGLRMSVPLIILCVFSLIGGLITVPLEQVFPSQSNAHPTGAVAWITMTIAIVGVLFSYLLYLSQQINVEPFLNTSALKKLRHFWYSGWAMDALYDRLLVAPYKLTASLLKTELIDRFYNLVVESSVASHRALSITQNGKLRTYAINIVVGIALLTAFLTGIV